MFLIFINELADILAKLVNKVKMFANDQSINQSVIL